MTNSRVVWLCLGWWALRADVPFALFPDCVRYNFSNVFFALRQMFGRDYPRHQHNIFRYFTLLAQHSGFPVMLIWPLGEDHLAATELRLSLFLAQTRWECGAGHSYVSGLTLKLLARSW